MYDFHCGFDNKRIKLYIQTPLNAMWSCNFSPSECVALFDCTSMTYDSFFDALEEQLLSQKMRRPVKKISDVLNVSIDMTVVGILGVVSLWDANKPANVAPYVSWVILKYVSTLEWKASVDDRVHMAGPGTFSKFILCETLYIYCIYCLYCSKSRQTVWRYLSCLQVLPDR